LKILVTGANGFIGRELTKELRKLNYKVIPVDIKGTDSPLDIRDFYEISRCLMTNNFRKEDKIIHLAAKVAGMPSLKDPYTYYQTNILGTLNILENMRILKLKYLIFLSSWSTLGSRVKLPITEKTKLKPENPYGVSKQIGEILVKSYSQLYGFKSIIFRPTMIYGPNQKEPNLLQQVVQSMINKKKFIIFGKGYHTRELLHVRDMVRVIIKSLDYLEELKDPYEVFVVGTEDPWKVRDLVNLGKTISDFEVEYKESPTWSFPQRSYCWKLRTKLGIDPKTFIPLEKGLSEVYKARLKELKRSKR